MMPMRWPVGDTLAFAQIADDAAGDEAGDLDKGDLGTGGRRQPDRHPLVIEARLRPGWR